MNFLKNILSIKKQDTKWEINNVKFGVILLVLLFILMNVVLVYPKWSFFVLVVGVTLIFSWNIGLWRSMILISSSATVLRSSAVGYMLTDFVWYIFQFTPLCIAIIFLLTRPRQKLRKIDRIILVTLGLFNLTALFTTLTGIAAKNTLLQASLLILVSVFLGLTYTRRWSRQNQIRGDLATIFIFMVVVQGIGLLGSLLNFSWAIADYGRFQGVFSNANYAGMISVIGIMLSLYLIVTRKHGTGFFYVLPGLILVITLILSGSRGALLAIFFGILALMGVNKHRKLLIPITFIATSLALSLLMIYLSFFEFGSNGGSFDRTIQNSDITSGRVEIYKVLIINWLESPLFGTGYKTTEMLKGIEGISGHNIYLSVLAEMGIIGCFLFIFLIFNILRGGQYTGENKMLLGAVITVFAMELTESSMFGFGGPTALFAWIIVLAFASSRNKLESTFNEVNK